jgi:hypothetical protein
MLDKEQLKLCTKLEKLFTRAIYTNEDEGQEALFNMRAEDLQWKSWPVI